MLIRIARSDFLFHEFISSSEVNSNSISTILPVKEYLMQFSTNFIFTCEEDVVKKQRILGIGNIFACQPTTL